MSSRKIKIRFLCFLMILFFSGLAFGEHMVLINGTATYFEYRRTITIQSGQVAGGPHSNFPMLFDSTKVNSGLRDDLKLWPTGKVKKSNGDDIVFATGNGIEILKHEIEKYDNSTGEYIAWVRIESINDGTVFYLYYGSDDSITYPANFTTDVWSNNYRGVWHLKETSGDALDSTTYGTNGTVTGTTRGVGVAGQIGSAYDFDDNSDLVDFGDPGDGHLDFGENDFTYSAWLNLGTTVSGNKLTVYKGGTSAGTEGYSMLTTSSATSVYSVISDGLGNQVYNLPASPAGWILQVAVVNRTSDLIKTYLGGSEVDSDNIASVGSVDTDQELTFSHTDYPCNAIIDEVRISDIARSAGWIETCFNNQDNPANFYSISAPTLVELSYFSANSLDSAVLLEWATETELDNAGFNLWRSEVRDGEYTRINPYFIPAEGESGFGAEYSYTDYDVQNGKIYYYKLEDIDIYGKSTFHGPVPAIPNDIIIIWPPDRIIRPSDALVFSCSSSGSYAFKVEISTNLSFLASHTLFFPEDGWISGNSLWLTPREWEIVLRMARQLGGQLFWRVRARSEDGRVIFSDWRKFVIEKHKLPNE